MATAVAAAPPHSLRAILEAQAARLGGRPLLSLPKVSLSYADTDELANRTANFLTGLGVRPGDVVATLCGNSSAQIATWFGCAKLGAVFMPVNALLTGDPLRRVLEHAKVTIVVCDPALYPALAEVRDGLPELDRVLVPGATPAGCMPFDGLLAEAPATPPPPLDDQPGAAAKLLYTSGTTGTPKGVVWSRQCEATWARCYGDELVNLAEGEAAYCCLPLSHVTCQGTLLATLWRGGRITIDAAFDPFGFWTRVRAADAGIFTFVGAILSVLARRPERPDDADNPTRRILGSAAPAAQWRDIERRFDVEIMEVWGQTETASCWTRPVRLPQRPGTVGRPTERFEARIVGPDGRDLPAGHAGELWIRPTEPHVMFAGYLGPSGVTAQDWSTENWTADGWYRTGDLMSATADGDHTFAGRLREAIRRRGEMIPAGDVEAAALGHRAVAEAAAVGVPAEGGVEEEVKLCVVAVDGAGLDPADLHRHLVRVLPRFMVPRYVDVLPELPKTPTTRVRKRLLAEQGVARAWDARRARSRPRP